MDPFTERLLERTRARRENLQKKMAERPNAPTRAMVKRPLALTNGVTSEPVADKVPQLSSKPSPSKRRCSEENLQPAAGEENEEPVVMKPAAPLLTDPPTDKKPPLGTASTWHSSSLENTASRPTVQSQPEQLKNAQPELEEPTVTLAMHPPISREEETDPVPLAGGMRSRLQRLAEQRKCWDSSDGAETLPDTPTALLNRRAEVPAAPSPSVSSVPPLGRRGRLANLAATIGSWEDDLSHANIPQEKFGEKSAAIVPRLAARDSAMAAGSETSSSADSTCSQAAFSPVKSSKMVLPGSQKDCVSGASSALRAVTSVQKSSIQGAAFRSSPLRATPSPPTPVLKSPLKYQAGSRGHGLPSSPQRPQLSAKPTIAGHYGCQDKPPAGTPGVKSFLEHFEERCQERTNQSSPAGGTTHTKGPSVTSSVTPNTRMVQERLRAAECANTSTADLTQRQKLERESELARIRSRFQKSSDAWKNQHEAEECRNNMDIKEQLHEPVEAEGVSCELQDQPTAPSDGKTATPTKCHPPGPGLMVSPPASASSPLKVLDEAADGTPEDEEKVRGTEMNVDQSINSAVINGLFDGILEQNEDQDDEEEEDALNISSMSLLNPLAETVAAVVKSPERMMTSTPASSFIVKSGTPDGGSKLGGFQRTAMIRTSSLESVSDEDPRLPYSIDAYRSTRLKETERPTVKQVIVRKEDVPLRAEEPRGSGVSTSKHRMKMLTNEVNLQQTVIHQASQALNCCTDEEHGKGSQVEAEAQRLLLVATERREALKAELDRLKGDPADQKRAVGGPEPGATSASRGSVSLQEFRLPLKADFVCSIANKPEATKYSFFILIRAGVENTVATPLASTHRSLSGDTLAFPTKFTMSDVSSDFEIDIEVYGLVQKRDMCSDKKKKHSKSKAITPKRFLAITKSVQPPVVASPGGPNTIRTSNFVLVGFHKLTLSSIGRNKFPLEKIKPEGDLSGMFHTKVPFLCPLEGNVYLKLQCEVGSKVEERGFLTMFEDVSGFGAWHRRWCVLSGSCISYWTYPDDERRKNPIGRLSLANCTSQKVEPANREFCARPNTFELITVRPQREDDRETLVSQCQDTMCVTKNWLSADTKDERNLWMRKLNQILVDLRVWQPASVTPAFIV